MLDMRNAAIANEAEPSHKAANYKEITGATWNNMVDTMIGLGAILEHLEGNSMKQMEAPDFRCYRDTIQQSLALSFEICKTVKQIAEAIGV